MPFAIHVFFDSATERSIRTTWKELADKRISSLYGAANRPHLLLAVYDELDIVECTRRLRMFAEMSSPFALAFSSLGILPVEKAFMFLVPTVTQKLLDIHAYILQLLQDVGTSSEMTYMPEHWNPHCTLAFGVEPAFTTQAIEIGLALPFPMYCQAEEIGVVEYWPLKHLCSFQLGGG